MKTYKKIISLSLAALMFLMLCAACSMPELPEFPGRSNDSATPREPVNRDNTTPSGGDITIDTPPESIPLAQPPAIPIILTPVASGTRVEQNNQAIIDYSNAADGYVMVKWLTSTDKQLRVQVTGPTGVVYTYIIFPDNTFNVLPLSDGSGSYEVRVFEQNNTGKFSLILSKNLSANLVDEFAPFLRPNKFVNFDENSKVVIKASELVGGKKTLTDVIAAIYDFVISNFTYDTDFAQQVIAGGQKGYIPDLDSVLERRKGICFDYAAVMTAMLRSQGVPTKMVFGYADDVYHAWISVFSEDTGWIDQVIFFDGENWTMMDPTFAAAAGSSSNLQAFVGTGGIYTVTELY